MFINTYFLFKQNPKRMKYNNTELFFYKFPNSTLKIFNFHRKKKKKIVILGSFAKLGKQQKLSMPMNKFDTQYSGCSCSCNAIESITLALVVVQLQTKSYNWTIPKFFSYLVMKQRHCSFYSPPNNSQNWKCSFLEN